MSQKYLIFLFLCLLVVFSSSNRCPRYAQLVPRLNSTCLREYPPLFTPDNYMSYLFSAYILNDMDNNQFKLASSAYDNLQQISSKKLDELKLETNKSGQGNRAVKIITACLRSACPDLLTTFIKNGLKLFDVDNIDFTIIVLLQKKFRTDVKFKNLKLLIGNVEPKMARSLQTQSGAWKVYLENFQGYKVPSSFMNHPEAYLEVISSNLEIFTNFQFSNVNIFIKSNNFFENVLFIGDDFFREYEELFEETLKDCSEEMAPYRKTLRFMMEIRTCEDFVFNTNNAWVTSKLLDLDENNREYRFEKVYSNMNNTLVLKMPKLESEMSLKMQQISKRLYNLSKLPFAPKFWEERIFSNEDQKIFFHLQHIHKYLLWADPKNKARVFNEMIVGRKTVKYQPQNSQRKIKDLIITVGVNFWNFTYQLLGFLKTCRENHPPDKVDLIFLVNDDKMKEAEAFFKGYNVILAPFWQYLSTKNIKGEELGYNNLFRFISSFDLLRTKSYRRVLFTDSVDAVFQGNVFEYFPSENEDYILSNNLKGISNNEDRNTIIDRAHHGGKIPVTGSLWKYYGYMAALVSFGAARICAGTIGADLTSFLWLSLIVPEEPIRYSNFLNDDQVIYNHLMHKWMKTVLPAVQLPNGFLFFRIESEIINDEKPNCVQTAVTLDGSYVYNEVIPPIIHQYDFFFIRKNPLNVCVMIWMDFLEENDLEKLLHPVLFLPSFTKEE